jgi:glucose-6-phosphate 1-dehydrogenase
MEFHYARPGGWTPPEAYERLLLDAMLGDPTLFIRADEVEASWAYMDRILEGWTRNPGRDRRSTPLGAGARPTPDALWSGTGRAWRRL